MKTQKKTLNSKCKGTDSKHKLNYRSNLNEPVKEKIKFSHKKRKENWWILTIFNSLQVEDMFGPSILSTDA